MLRTLRIYRRMLGANLRAVLEYEADFWILVVAGAMFQGLNLLFLKSVFAHVPTLNGWTFPEALLLAGMFGVVIGTGPLFFEGTWRLAGKINHGELDYALVRPAPVPVQVISAGIGLHGIGDMVAGGAMIAWALSRLDLAWSPVRVVLALVLLASAVTVNLSLVVLGNCASFWIAGPHPFFAVTLMNINNLVRYPIGIFGLAVRAVLTLVVPWAFMTYFPVAWLLGKPSPWIGLLTPLAALYLALLARTVFRAGLRRYDSAGH
ncbi:ABC-2 family transporter protein [Catellatospora sp. KI3]|uniref:ABC transporter permease n=1 Tax=Catellatospora sp. KI3 TaxID=3041620 RepID=UPI00248228E2|nr:ABC-2 family transporter protein [Catellatospora sp. KI3]MDI1459693.1 ABC-2 family transporter protein [Catellatospora sp. KI3]